MVMQSRPPPLEHYVSDLWYIGKPIHLAVGICYMHKISSRGWKTAALRRAKTVISVAVLRRP
jgi:hypothetical protein